MKSIFEEMGGTYRQVGDYFIPQPCLAGWRQLSDRQIRAYAPQLSERVP